jgi:hypothetical protein
MKLKESEKAARAERLAKANELLAVIAGTGRKFFAHRGTVSRLELDARSRVWFVDAYTGRRIYTHHSWGEWRGFTQGGTMRVLVVWIQKYVLWGNQFPASQFGPWPSWVCGSDLWGYGEDIQKVRDAAARLGMVREKQAAA